MPVSQDIKSKRSGATVATRSSRNLAAVPREDIPQAGTAVAMAFPSGVQGALEWHRGRVSDVQGFGAASRFDIRWESRQDDTCGISIDRARQSMKSYIDLTDSFREIGPVVPDRDLRTDLMSSAGSRQVGRRNTNPFDTLEEQSGSWGQYTWLLLNPQSSHLYTDVVDSVLKLYGVHFSSTIYRDAVAMRADTSLTSEEGRKYTYANYRTIVLMSHGRAVGATTVRPHVTFATSVGKGIVEIFLFASDKKGHSIGKALRSVLYDLALSLGMNVFLVLAADPVRAYWKKVHPLTGPFLLH